MVKDNVSVGGRVTAVLIVVLMLTSAVTVIGQSDSSYAASSEGITDLSISIFDQDSEDLSGLIYLSNELPDSLSAAEWILGDDGVWYNVNSSSPSYGSALTYGTASATAVAVKDILDKYSAIFTSDFLLVQITYTLKYACSVSLDLSKDGSSVYTNSGAQDITASGYTFTSGMTRSVVLSVKDSGADINVADTRGIYSVSASYNGIPVNPASVPYAAGKLSVGGLLKDVDNKPVSGATVNYKVGTTSGSVVSGTDGRYAFLVDYGSEASLTGIIASGYTFATAAGYSYGAVTADITNGDFSAPQHTVKVTVRDSGGNPAVGVSLTAIWYSQTGSGPYDIITSVTGIDCTRVTGTDGSAVITVVEPDPLPMKLYIKANDIDLELNRNNYHFAVDAMPSGTASASSVPDTLVEAGNRYADLSIYGDIELVAMEKSATITVAGAMDGLSGGAALPDATVTVMWYYQVETGTGFIIRDNDHISGLPVGSFANLVKGEARVSKATTGADGTVTVIYKEPEWTPNPDDSAFLVIVVTGATATSPTSLYTFASFTVPQTSTDPIDVLAAPVNSCVAVPVGAAFAGETLRAEEVAYTLEGTISGTVPDSVEVHLITSTFGYGKTVDESAGTISFTFPVKAGVAYRVDLAAVEGYEFDPASKSTGTVTGDLSFTSTSSAVVVDIDRSATVAADIFTVTGLPEGDQAIFTYTVAGTTVTAVATAGSVPLEFKAYGRTGNIVEDVSVVSAGGAYIGELSGNTATAYPLSAMGIVTYSDSSAGEPTLENVISNTTVSAYFGEDLLCNITTGADGTANASLPDISNVTFKMGTYSVPGAIVASGPFKDYVAVNLYGVVEPPAATEVNLTIRYYATSSMQNSSTPTSIEIMDSPVHRTLTIGTTETFIAPELSGFAFAGWTLDGQMISSASNKRVCSLTVTEGMEGSTLAATYAALAPEPPAPDYGTVIAIGMVAVVIALIAFIFVLLHVRRY